MTAVEIYGDYWHKIPKVVERDKQREKTLEKYGWKRLILWGNELKELPEEEIVQSVRRLCS